MEIQELKRLQENESITLEQEAETIINSFTRGKRKKEILALHHNDIKFFKKSYHVKIICLFATIKGEKNMATLSDMKKISRQRN